MVSFNFQFDARTVKPDEGMQPIPGGQYKLAIVKTNIKEVAKKPDADPSATPQYYLAVQMQVIEGPYQGRQFSDNLNLWNASAQAVEIAKARLSAYCHATGVLQASVNAGAADDLVMPMLHNIPFLADVGVDKDYNRIKKVMPLGAGGAGQPGPQFTQAPQGTPAQAVWGGAPAAGAGGWGAPAAPAPAPVYQPPAPAPQPAPLAQPAPAYQQPTQPQPAPAQQPQAFQPVAAEPPAQGWPQPAQHPAPVAAPPQQGWVAQQPAPVAQAGPPAGYVDPNQPPQGYAPQPVQQAAQPAPAMPWQPQGAPTAPAGPAPWAPQG